MKRENDTSFIEEVFNALTHGLAAVAGIVGLVFLIVRGHALGGGYRLWSVVIFGVTLVLLYLASTLYHSLIFTRARHIFKKIDYTAIALFIAGTYTPIALIPLRTHHGWWLLGGIWALTIFGIIWRLFGVKKDAVSLALYLLTGWIMIVFIRPLSMQISQTALILLVLGGVSYTVGTIFYRWRRLAFNHMIWHLFVITGSVLHFLSIMRV